MRVSETGKHIFLSVKTGNSCRQYQCLSHQEGAEMLVVYDRYLWVTKMLHDRLRIHEHGSSGFVYIFLLRINPLTLQILAS